jgi:flagellar biosynthesis protein FlhG
LRIITLASGKGGVGKTVLAANIGVVLAESGYNVLLFDADLGLANLDVVLGVKSEVTVQHAIDGIASLREVMVEGPAGVRVITGSSGVGKMIRLSRKRLEAFLQQLSEIEKEIDFLIFDAAAGADAKVITFLRTADEALLVTTPDPTSIVDVYAVAKVLFRNKPDALVRILVNMVENEQQAQRVFSAVQSAVTKFIDKPVHYGGFVHFDPLAAQLVRERTPFVQAAPNLPASRDVKSIAAKIIHMSRSLEDTAVDHLRSGSTPSGRKAA